jgi:hypothetical protein
VADKIRVTLEVDASKGLVTLRDFDRASANMSKSLDQTGKTAGQAETAFSGMGSTLKSLIPIAASAFSVAAGRCPSA